MTIPTEETNRYPDITPEDSTQQYAHYSLTSITLSNSPGVLFNAGTLSNASFDRYTLKLKVTLYHNGVPYDLTPYIMQLKTHMSLSEPSGKFTMMLTFQKRWDEFIQPQDYVEIQFSRYLASPPIMMRGLVSNIRRTRIMSESGKLHRAITVNGENYGKLWRQYQINYQVNLPGQTNQNGIDTDPAVGLMFPQLTYNYGIGTPNDVSDIKPTDLMQGITDKMLNAQVRAMQKVNPQMPLLNLLPSVLFDYSLNYLQIQQVQGSIYSLIQQYGNAPWCEWFIDDFSDGPVFFYRNTPFKRRDGQLSFPESLPDQSYFIHPEISDIDIIEEDTGHSDREAYSYFFTYPTTYLVEQAAWKAKIIADQNIKSIEDEANTTNISNPHVDLDNLYRYGFQKIEIGSPAISARDDFNALNLSLKMNRWLVDSFVWAPMMLNGTIRMKGNEHMRIGRYFTNISTNEEYYIESVDHDIVIGQVDSDGGDNVFSFQTTLGVTRGRSLS